MKMLPTSWPAPDALVAPWPEVFAIFENVAWPPAFEDMPQGVSRVLSWSTSRQITGGLLPGQVRGATGFAIGSGSIAIPQPEAWHETLAPWRRDAARVPDGPFTVRLVASYDGPDGASVVPLGRWQAQARSGSIADGAISIDLLERTTDLREMIAVPPFVGATSSGVVFRMDAVGVIDFLARRVGLCATPAPVMTCLASMPLCGSYWPEVGTAHSVMWASGSWDGARGFAPDGFGAGPDGRVWPVPSMLDGSLRLTRSDRQEVFVTFDVTGLPAAYTSGLSIIATDSAGNNATWQLGATSFAGTSWTPGVSADHPYRVQVRIVRTSATTAQAWVRSGPSAVWSAVRSATVTSTYTRSASDTWTVVTLQSLTTLVAVRGVQVSEAAEPGLWAAPTAVLEPSGASIAAVILDPVADAWAQLQEILKATLCVGVFDDSGVWHVRGPESMRGLGAVAQEVVVADRLTDVSWQVDPGEISDRRVVTASPPVVQVSSSGSVPVWESTDVIIVPAGRSVEVKATFEGVTVMSSAPWQMAVTGTETDGSRWLAGRADTPTTQVTSGITVATTALTASGATIRITNDNGFAIQIADGTSSPHLILRAQVAARAGEQIQVEDGVAEDLARTPVSLDLGVWGELDEAQRALSWLSSQTETAQWTAVQVQLVAPDFRIEAGDVVRLVDVETALRTKAVITGVDLDGSSSGVNQSISIAVLDVTVWDVDQTFVGLTVAQVDQMILAQLGASATVAQVIEWMRERGQAG